MEKPYKVTETERFLAHLRRLPAMPPKEMDERLAALGYKGQFEARRAACLFAYRHVRRLKKLYLERVPRERVLPKSNYLFVGPTGCGKTFLIELLFREIIKLPTVIVDVTSYSETGYVGQDTNSILTRLLHAAGHSVMWASVGIVCLDEFDKLASGKNNAVFAGAGTTKDVTGLGVQRELLKMLEETEVVVPTELGQASYGEYLTMSTADVSFVACGAFSGLHEVIRQDRTEESIGFGRGTGHGEGDTFGRGHSAAELEHVDYFYKYGFLPELIARFTRIVPFDALSADTLREILTESVVTKLAEEFQSEGLELVVEESVLDHIVSRAIRRQTGARGLATVLMSHLESVAFEHFGQGRQGRVLVSIDSGKIKVDGP